jgi:hypothetical protein
MISTTMLPAAATDYKVGVKVGDTADYTYLDTVSNPTAIGTLHIKITYINGTDVTILVQELYLNNSIGWTDYLTGTVLSDLSEPQQYLVPANLSQGDNIYGETGLLDKTITMIVGGQARTVNHFKFTGLWRPPIDISISEEAYYDKITGLLVESILTWTNLRDGTTHSDIQTLTSTTAFNSSDTAFTPNPAETTVAPLIIAAAIAFIAVTVAVAAITQRRKLKTTTH